MSADTINLVILSGKVGWVKIKYTNANQPFVTFTVMQVEYQYDNNIIVAQSNVPYFITCFDSSEWSERTLKEGAEVIIQGKLTPFMMEKHVRYNIVAKEITVLVKKDE